MPVAGPLVYSILRNLGSWKIILRKELAARGPDPLDFIPRCFIESRCLKAGHTQVSLFTGVK